MEEGGSLQEQEICLSAGCYTFIITDSYGDGLVDRTSCINGTPFSITSQQGELLFEETNPTFGDCQELGDESLYDDTPCSELLFRVTAEILLMDVQTLMLQTWSWSNK